MADSTRELQESMATYVLHITSPDNRARTLAIKKSTAIVGREVGDVIVSDPRCSSRHAQLDFNGRELRIQDLQSTNGTFFGGQRITDMIWPLRGTLHIGKHELTLHAIRGETGTILQTGVVTPPGPRRRPPAGYVASVCARIAEHFAVSASFVSFTFCVLTLANGLGFLLYLVLWALMGREAQAWNQPDTTPTPFSKRLAAIREHPALTYSVGVIGILATLAKGGGDFAEIVDNVRKILHVFGSGTLEENSPNSLHLADPVRDEIRRVILAADQAEIEANRSLNPSGLANYFAEPLLAPTTKTASDNQR